MPWLCLLHYGRPRQRLLLQLLLRLSLLLLLLP
jgi:hypothetical protein